MPEVTRSSFHLDPRTKLLLTAAASSVVVAPGGERFLLPTIFMGTLLLALHTRTLRGTLGFPLTMLAFFVLSWVLPTYVPGALTNIFAVGFAYMLRFGAAGGLGIYMMISTSPGDFSAALRAMRVPRVVNVPFTVMLRFLPTVVQESASVKDAMRLRGISGPGGMLRHPLLAMERFMVPMIASSLRAAEDLSASAILRGLGSHRKPTVLVPPRFTVQDALILALAAILVLASFYLPLGK
ncbi:energy-coupling factor transporter transmembrane component T [Dermabacteraceae bacterium P13115]|nr:energy-coupling factor transporter transmembrane protein EcfT [Dermabacteraceae bacterium TAE3-ERU5]